MATPPIRFIVSLTIKIKLPNGKETSQNLDHKGEANIL